MSWLKSLFGRSSGGRRSEPAHEDRSDPVFGMLTYDASLAGFKGEADWFGQPIQLLLVIEGRELDDGLRLAHGLWRDKEALDGRMRMAMVNELLALKNDSWLEEGEAAVTEAEMLARVQPSSMSFYIDTESGGYEFMFGDGDLFWGHSIVVSGGSDDDALHVSLFG